MSVVLAHQGGWDEALFVVVPLLVLVWLLRVASRRADAERRRASDPESEQ